MQDYLYNLATDKYEGFIASSIKFLLFILSLIYGLAVKILILFYRLFPYRLNCKVISVGNITLGGTGKTSLVEYIARYLKQEGHKVAILSRGYKRKITRYRAVNSNKLGMASYETMGDEPYMLSKRLGDIPVIVEVDRIRAGTLAIKDYNVDTVILDDGFQQWRIKRDLDIVTIDATDPLGNRHLLPRGILRESPSSLKRADALVLTKTNINPDTQDIKDFLTLFNPSAQIFESIHNPTGFYKLGRGQELLNIDVLKGKVLTVISGIADPDSFENLIASLGIEIGLSFRFPDHYNYSQEDLEGIVQASKKKNIDTLVTTEKDAVRFYQLPITNYQLPIFVLRIELKITKNEEGFRSRLRKLYSL